MHHFTFYAAKFLVLLLSLLVPSQLHANEHQVMDDLQRQLPGWEFQQVGHEPETFTVLHRPAMTSFAKGTLVLIPDTTLHPATPRQINFLRLIFNDLGWHTIALMPPTMVTPDRDEHEILQQRLNQLFNNDAMPAGHLVLLAQGTSANLLTNLDWAALARSADALVLLSSYAADPVTNRALAKRIGSLTIPTLDIAHTHDHLHIEKFFQERQQWNRKNANLLYRQRLLTGYAELETTQHAMVKELYGWLSYLGL